MGMYTELVLNIGFGETPDDEVISILNFLADDGEEPSNLPDHKFFQCPRWKWVMNCSSYYFVPFATTRLVHNEIGGWYLSTRFDLKNYDREIEEFLDWLMPYIDALPGEFLGYHRYEEDEHPTLIFYP